MFYQEALPEFRFLFHVDSLLTIRDIHWQKVATTFEKAKSVIHFCLHRTGAFSCGVPIFLWVLIMRCGCNQNGCLYSWGAYYPDFTVLHSTYLDIYSNIIIYNIVMITTVRLANNWSIALRGFYTVLCTPTQFSVASVWKVGKVHDQYKGPKFAELQATFHITWKQQTAWVASNPGSPFRILSPKLRDKIRNGKPGFKATAWGGWVWSTFLYIVYQYSTV